MPPNALLRYELALFVRSFGDAFRRKRDKLLLGAVVALGLLWVQAASTGAGAAALPPGGAWLALAAAPISFSWNAMLLRRLAWIREHSPLAPAAAAEGVRRLYLAIAQLPVLIPACLASLAIGEAAGRPGLAAGAAAVAYAAGLMAARFWSRFTARPWPEGRSGRAEGPEIGGRHAAFLALVRVQLRGARRPARAATLLLLANALLSFAAWRLVDGQTLRFAAAALPSLLLLAATARNDAQLVGFLSFRGKSAASVAIAVSALPAASLAAAAAALIVGGGADRLAMLALLLLVHLGFALIAVARAWLSPGRDGRRVDLQVKIEAAALAAAAFAFLPLAAVLLLARMWTLRRSYASSMWLAP
jgi:hypothetical protein